MLFRSAEHARPMARLGMQVPSATRDSASQAPAPRCRDGHGGTRARGLKRAPNGAGASARRCALRTNGFAGHAWAGRVIGPRAPKRPETRRLRRRNATSRSMAFLRRNRPGALATWRVQMGWFEARAMAGLDWNVRVDGTAAGAGTDPHPEACSPRLRASLVRAAPRRGRNRQCWDDDCRSSSRPGRSLLHLE